MPTLRPLVWLPVLCIAVATLISGCSALDQDLNLLRKDPMATWTNPGVIAETRSETPARPYGVIPSSEAVIVRSLTFADENAALTAQAAARRAAQLSGWKMEEPANVIGWKQMEGRLSSIGITGSLDDAKVLVISISI